jgi:hypothetical protein
MDPMEEDVPIPAPVQGDEIRFGEISRASGAEMLQAGVAAGNIYRQTADAEVMALPEVWLQPASRGDPHVVTLHVHELIGSPGHSAAPPCRLAACSGRRSSRSSRSWSCGAR